MSNNVGLDEADIAACYRGRAADLADSTEPKPRYSVCVEFSETGTPFFALYGDTGPLNYRENANIVLQAIGVLSDVAVSFNAQASN